MHFDLWEIFPEVVALLPALEVHGEGVTQNYRNNVGARVARSARQVVQL